MRANTFTLCLFLVVPSIAVAAKQQAKKQHDDEQLPDAALLEFIAEFEPLDGQWIDPIQLNMIFAENRNGKDTK